MECFTEGVGGQIPRPAYPDVSHAHLLPHLTLLRLCIW